MKVRMTPVTSLLALLVLVLAACGETNSPAQTASPVQSAAPTNRGLPLLPKNAAGYMDLSVKQLAESMASKNFTLINVHVPDEGNLPNTDLSIPFDQIKSNLDKLPGKDAPIVLYCRSGGMSTEAAAALAAAGYTKLYELDGGFDAWKRAGHHLLTK
jgi:rhodanese-related sulfurtransferase